MLSVNDRGAAVLGLVLALAFTPRVAVSQNASIQVGANSTQDDRQIERLAMRVVRGEFTKRGATDLTTVGLDPDMDASLKPLHAKRDEAQVQGLLAEVGGRRFSRDSVRPNSPQCRLNSLTRLVYLSTPAITGDSATVRVLYNLKDQQRPCRFFDESKTLSFALRGKAWVFTGIQASATSR